MIMMTIGVWVLGVGIWFLAFTQLPLAVILSEGIREDDEDGTSVSDS